MSYGSPYFSSADYRRNIVVDGRACIKCGSCAEKCPARVIVLPSDCSLSNIRHSERCLSCYQCISVCPVHAISIGAFPAEGEES